MWSSRVMEPVKCRQVFFGVFFLVFLNQLALPNTSHCSTSIKGTWNNNLLTLYELRVVHIVFKC